MYCIKCLQYFGSYARCDKRKQLLQNINRCCIIKYCASDQFFYKCLYCKMFNKKIYELPPYTSYASKILIKHYKYAIKCSYNFGSEWYIYGIIKRCNDKPSIEYNHSDGLIYDFMWSLNGVINRDNDKPAHLYISKNLNIIQLEWKQFNRYYREGGTICSILLDNSGNINKLRHYRKN